MSRRFDAIVIGAGLGGLSAATALAARGYGVALIEKRSIPGGFASSFVRGRFEFEASLHELSGVGHPSSRGELWDYLDSLGITDKVEFVPIDEVYRSIFPDLDITLPTGRDAFETTLVEAFPREKEGISRLIALIEDIWNEVVSIQKQVKAVDPRKVLNTVRYLPATWKQVLDQYVTDPLAQAVLSQSWGYYGLGPSECSFLLLAMGLRDYYVNGPSYIKGRSQRLSDAFVERLEELGAEVIFNKEVTRIVMEGNRPSGVITDDGEHLDASVVVSNASPATAFSELLGLNQLPRKLLSSIAYRQPATSSINVYLGMAKSPEELGLTSYEVFLNRDLDLDSHARAMYTVAPPKEVALTTYNTAWSDVSPPGTTMSVITALSYGEPWLHIAPEEYFDTKNAIADSMLRMVEENLSPTIRENTEVIAVSTPLTNIRFADTVLGAIYGSAPTPANATALRFPYTSPIKGLFFVGAWTPPGGGYGPTITSGQRASDEIHASFAARGWSPLPR